MSILSRIAREAVEHAAEKEAAQTAARRALAVPRIAAPVRKGLDMRPEARMERAKSMGFDTNNPLFVSTLRQVSRFDPHGAFQGHKGLSGISLADNPALASRYLDRYGLMDWRGIPFEKQMMPVFIRPGNVRRFSEPLPGSRTGHPLPEGYQWPAQLQGVDTAIFPDAVSRRGGVKHVTPGSRNAVSGHEYILRDPSRVRGMYAAFDPEEASSDVLMKKYGGAV